MPTNTPRIFTKDEIRAFTLEEAEKYAASLSWKKSHSWSTNTAPYQHEGFPSWFANKTFQNRREFLIHRLLTCKQEKWNSESAVLWQAQKAAEQEAKRIKEQEELAKLALEPRLKVVPEIAVTAELRDIRPKGYWFTFKRKGDYIRCQQKQGKGSVGRKVCTEEVNLKAKDLLDAITLVINLPKIELPKIELDSDLKVHNAQPYVIIGKSSNHAFRIEASTREKNVVHIYETSRYDDYSNSAWYFDADDLRSMVAALMDVEYDLVKKETK